MVGAQHKQGMGFIKGGYMRKITLILLALILLLCCIPVNSQTSTHSVVLTWTLSTDDTAANCPAGAPCSQNVYRASGNCSATSNFQPLSPGMAGTWSTTVPPTPPPSMFTDTTVTAGTWCYAVSFVLNGAESPKASAQVSVIPAAPSSLVIVAK